MPAISPVITTLTAVGQSIQPEPPIRSAAGGDWEVRIDNATGFALQVVVGGTAYWQSALSSCIYQGSGPVEVVLTARALMATIATPQLFLMWASHPDKVPPQGSLAGSVSVATGGVLDSVWVQNSATQNAPDGGVTILTHNVQIRDTNSYWDPAFPTIFTIPSGKDGLYLAGFSPSWVNGLVSAGGFLAWYFFINGSATNAGFSLKRFNELEPSNRQAWPMATPLILVAGQTVSVGVDNRTGAQITVDNGCPFTLVYFGT